MRRLGRCAVLLLAAVPALVAQFHLPGISGSSSPKPDAPAPKDSTPKDKASVTPPSAPAAALPAAPAKFDYYALTIAWPAGKVAVKGLAPEMVEGRNPESCGPVKPASKGAMSIVASVMPDRSAVQQEWLKHGSCTGFAAAEYFNTLRFTRSRVQIPVQLTSPDEDSPAETPKLIEAWFTSANPSFPAGAFRAAAANEVEVCFDLQLRPMACPTGSK